MWEGGIRVPGMMHFPRLITANKNVSTPATTADFMPTIMSILEVSPLAANRSADDPLLYTTPNFHVKKGYPNTDGVNNVSSANRFAAKRFRWRRTTQTG